MTISKWLQNIQNELDELKRVNDELRMTNEMLTKELWPRLAGIPVVAPEPKEEIYYKVGQKFRYVNQDGNLNNEVYLFAQTGVCEVNLIGMAGGNRWTVAGIMPNSMKVPKSEFDKLFNGPNAQEWVLVP